MMLFKLSIFSTYFVAKTDDMIHFSHLIFDLDGTLVNSKLGLHNALNYVLDAMSLDLDSEAVIDQLIGPPIQDGLKHILNFDEKQSQLAMKLFREYYSERGMYEAEVYPGILELLQELDGQGRKLYVATSKKNEFMKRVLRHFELDRYLVDAEGAGSGEKHTKAELITRVMDRNQIFPSQEVVMVGDTKFDIVGGKANEISTIAVAYGFGNNEELKSLNPDYFVEEAEDLFDLLA